MLWKRQTSNHELLERLESLERRFKTLLADVDEYFHLVRRAENRMAKKTMLESQQTVGTQEGNGQEPEITEPGPFSSLTPRQRQITEQILRRRRHGAGEVQ